MLDQVVEIIENNPKMYELLKNCPYQILKEWSIERYQKGEFLLHQGEVYEYFYIVVSGEIDIYILSEDGKKFSLAKYYAGHFIGEHEIFNLVPFSCSVESLSAVTLLKLEREKFLLLLDLDRSMEKIITRTLCTQFYNLSKKSGKAVLYTVKEQVCNYLLNSERSVRPGVFNKQQLLDYVPVNKRSIDRVLKNFSDRKIIVSRAGEIRVLDGEALELEGIK